METQIISELLKYGGLVGVLAYGLWIFWKRYDKFTERTQAELIALRQEVKDYMNHDKQRLETLVQQNTDVIQKCMKAADKNSEVMTCLISEIHDFKKSEVYMQHEKRKQRV